ncbi:MAG: Outer rane efflux protein [Pseudomonadota bacterium]|jgi:outer membrane protein TolC
MNRSSFRTLTVVSPLLALTPLLMLALAGSARAEVLKLEDIEGRAQRERSELLERRASIEKAEAEVALAESRSGPTLGARAEGGISPGGRLVRVDEAGTGDDYLVAGSRELGESGALTPQRRYAALLSGKITLLDFGRTALGVRAAEAALGAQRATVLQAKVELVQAARAAYLDWLEAHQTWQLAQRDAEVTRQRTASVRGLISEGARPATDATLSSYDEQLALLRQSRAARAATLALAALSASVQSELPKDCSPDLTVLAATTPSGSAGPSGGNAPAATPLAATPPADAPDDARNSLLGGLELQRQAALSAARAADRGAAPVLDAAAEVGVQGQDTRVFPVYKAGITLSVPIYDGGARKAQAAVYRADARALEARLKASEQKLRASRAVAHSRLESAAAELALSQSLLDTAELMLTQAEEHYKAGSDTLERVLNAQRSLVAARREVLTAQLETARARLELTPIRIQP